ncbi:MAG TPA: class I SAM-dependent methyltransferase [Acidimicrobiia bacterium]|nr:class I SAM-dependent methyltransferase [Acidimicrobiia bacterium]
MRPLSNIKRAGHRGLRRGLDGIDARFGPGAGARARRAATRLTRGNLALLAAVYGTDKGVAGHGYVRHYERYLRPLRSREIRLLEIGTREGASLRMWSDWFPRGEIIGLDIDEVHVDAPRVRTIVGDQSDPVVLERLADLGPFDVVIDDGSHRGADIITTFRALFPSVRPGGWYVVEDMQTAYDERYGGGAAGTPGTSVSLLKDLLDAVNRDAAGCDANDPVASVHAHRRIAFIERA